MRGTRLEGAVDILPRGTTLRPLRDQMIVKPLDWEPSKTIAVAHKKRTLRGVIVAIGPGDWYRHYYFQTLPNGRRERYAVKETDRRIPTQLKVGDVVELGSLEDYEYQYSFQEIIIGTEKHVVCQEKDVAVICG